MKLASPEQDPTDLAMPAMAPSWPLQDIPGYTINCKGDSASHLADLVNTTRCSKIDQIDMKELSTHVHSRCHLAPRFRKVAMAYSQVYYVAQVRSLCEVPQGCGIDQLSTLSGASAVICLPSAGAYWLPSNSPEQTK